MQLKYRGCSYDSNSTSAQVAPSNPTLIYRGVKYQPNSVAPQLATSQRQPLTYRGTGYFAG
ncbi:MAG: DUF4278 domain-containing protein [Leptolyngbya sp. UWPOB_LEPTO1]|uniref:DUF4278 domain-containing protein n=1 Tax=Leptolyngbya sp. UWPOB_LEPTO1 TaxID=2815653 RepID=UPI001ACD121F|nr:DUF4278 domain-containing protein [Leptolyngbya sp. UWPOB_LEPTO1]MBN8561091.1 DUF4278 domain-containing protein [Leptolyngbya sp. UWPOB_LEPTO1]